MLEESSPQRILTSSLADPSFGITGIRYLNITLEYVYLGALGELYLVDDEFARTKLTVRRCRPPSQCVVSSSHSVIDLKDLEECTSSSCPSTRS